MHERKHTAVIVNDCEYRGAYFLEKITSLRGCQCLRRTDFRKEKGECSSVKTINSEDAFMQIAELSQVLTLKSTKAATRI